MRASVWQLLEQMRTIEARSPYGSEHSAINKARPPARTHARTHVRTHTRMLQVMFATALLPLAFRRFDDEPILS